MWLIYQGDGRRSGWYRGASISIWRERLNHGEPCGSEPIAVTKSREQVNIVLSAKMSLLVPTLEFRENNIYHGPRIEGTHGQFRFVVRVADGPL